MNSASKPVSAGWSKESSELCCILWIAYCTFSALYSPQPLLQSIRSDLGIAQASAGLLMTVALLPLGLAPLVYGLFLSKIPLRSLLSIGMLLTACTLIAPMFTDSYRLFLAVRFAQGLVVPAMMLGLMFYISTHYSGTALQRAMALYTATTMIGSFSGRLICGYVASLWTWRAAFLLLILESLSAALAGLCLKKGGNAKGGHIPLKEIWAVLFQRDVYRIILIAPLCIFVHASILNFIPFFMHSLDSSISDFGISIIYLAALVCALLGVFSRQVVALIGGEIRTVICGILCFVLFLPVILLRSPTALFLALLGMSVGFAMVYTTMPGVMNRVSTHEKSVTNGVYLSVYYMFSAAGTYFPGLLYASAGLESYLGLLLCCMLLSLSIAVAGRSVQSHLK